MNISIEPIYGDLNYVSRNFGNLCDRQFRDSAKFSQKQKFGVRDKEQALKNLAIQQENLRKLKQAKGVNGGEEVKQRPLKDAGLNDKRGFLKKVVDFNNMKMVIMFKSIEIEAVKKGKNESVKGRNRISQFLFFEDLKYLIDNFTPDEISDLFKKCTYVQNNKIFVDYAKFSTLPSKKQVGSMLDKTSTFPQQQDYLQEDSSQNKNNDNQAGKYIIKVSYPQIEMYVSELAHKQIYYTKKKDILDLFKTKFESLKDYLRHFDSSKALKVQSDIQSAQRSSHQIDQTVQKGEMKRQDSDKSNKSKKRLEEEQQQKNAFNIQTQFNKKDSDEDLKLKQFQESLNERLKTISEQQQRTQDDEEEEDSRQIIQEMRDKSHSSRSSEKKSVNKLELNQSDRGSSAKELEKERYSDRQKSEEQLNEKKEIQNESVYEEQEAEYRKNSDQENEEDPYKQEFRDLDELTAENRYNQQEEREKIQQNGFIPDVDEEENQEQYNEERFDEEYNEVLEPGQSNQQQFIEEEDGQQFGEEGGQFNEQYEDEFQEGQEGQQYESQEGEQFEGQEQYQEGQEELYQEGQEEQQMDIPEFSIEDTEREYDPQILLENIYAQNIVWNDVGYIIGFKSLEIIIESNSFEGKIVKSLSFLELYTLIIETKEAIVQEYVMEKIQISENFEIILDLPQLEFDFQECYNLEEGHFYKFLDELNPFEINMEDQAYLIQFIKPSIEIQDEQGTGSRQLEIGGNTLQNVVQRGFHFDFGIPQQ